MAFRAFPAPTRAYRPNYKASEESYYAGGNQVRVETTITGNLLLLPTESTKAAVNGAIEATARAGTGWIQGDSPVDTGLLKSRWYTKPIKWDAWRISNDIYYTPYNEKRIKMMGRNLPRIQQELQRQLNDLLPKFLNRG